MFPGEHLPPEPRRFRCLRQASPQLKKPSQQRRRGLLQPEQQQNGQRRRQSSDVQQLGDNGEQQVCNRLFQKSLPEPVVVQQRGRLPEVPALVSVLFRQYVSQRNEQSDSAEGPFSPNSSSSPSKSAPSPSAATTTTAAPAPPPPPLLPVGRLGG